MAIDPDEPFELIHLSLVKRPAWGALPTQCRDTFQEYPINYVRHAFTDTEECFTREDCSRVMRDLQRRHMEEGHPDIKYNFLVGGDWSVYEGRGWRYLPPNPLPDYDPNWEFVDISYIGPSPHVGQRNYPCLEMKHALQRILEAGINLGYLDSNYNLNLQTEKFNAPRKTPWGDPSFKKM